MCTSSRPMKTVPSTLTCCPTLRERTSSSESGALRIKRRPPESHSAVRIYPCRGPAGGPALEVHRHRERCGVAVCGGDPYTEDCGVSPQPHGANAGEVERLGQLVLESCELGVDVRQ